jgi:hydrogenase maturation protein HypF
MPRIVRRHIEIEGIVQGVGFRPFVYQRAVGFGLVGWVLNDSRGVTVEVEGEADLVDRFLLVLEHDYPPLASLTRFDVQAVTPTDDSGFVIRASSDQADTLAQISPDTFVCDDCLRELFDPTDHRYRYPFINCTNCGPRYTIIQGVPYDRPKTTMADFCMCSSCQAEYDDPASRRFHAQPNACPDCGPQLSLTDVDGERLPGDPLNQTVELLRAGRIVAIKGLGGYHLAVDAGNDAALQELRRRKARDEKPFALMSLDLDQVSGYAEFDSQEKRLLTGVERPIVLLRQKDGHRLSPLVAPKNRYFGVMLPYTPLHFLLLQHFPALVMTSANISDEPVVFTDDAARSRLGSIADAFLAHNRRIHMRADDSIARVMAGQALLLRRARGYVPRSLLLAASQPSVLAVGAELKSTLCLTRGDRAYLSQHIGDLKNAEVLQSLAEANDHLQQILDLRPEAVAHDLHPDYLSTHFAEQLADLPKIAVQHHHAHLASCLAEHGQTGPAIGVVFDGIGMGDDGTLWGGEFLVGDLSGYQRVGHLQPVPMPGSDAATREPWRMAVSYLQHAYGNDWPDLPMLRAVAPADARLLQQMMEKRLNAPLTSSCGRLFDAVAALTGLRQTVSYEGQAALELEMAMCDEDVSAYSWELLEEDGRLLVGHAPLIRDVVVDLQSGCETGWISRRFHLTLAEMIADVCGRLRMTSGLEKVVLSGGVFQNRFLTEMSSLLLERAGFTVLRHSLVPPNDGGLALGQAVIAGALLRL